MKNLFYIEFEAVKLKTPDGGIMQRIYAKLLELRNYNLFWEYDMESGTMEKY